MQQLRWVWPRDDGEGVMARIAVKERGCGCAPRCDFPFDVVAQLHLEHFCVEAQGRAKLFGPQDDVAETHGARLEAGYGTRRVEWTLELDQRAVVDFAWQAQGIAELDHAFDPA